MGPGKIRIEDSPHRVATWATMLGYPRHINADDLAAHYIMVRLEDTSGTVGYAWASWADEGLLCVHICMSPKGYGRLEDFLPDLYRLAGYLGAHSVAVVPFGSGRHPAVMARYLTRLGFQPHEHGYYTKEI